MLDDYGLFRSCVLIAVCGGVGGVVGGWYNRKKGFSETISIVRWRDNFTFFTFGAICAFGVALFATALSSCLQQPAPEAKQLYLICIYLLTGFFCMRILPKLGGKLEERLNLVENRAEAAEKKLEETEKKAEDSMEYNRLLSFADTALQTGNPSDIKSAIDNIERHLEKFCHDRTLNIYLGRLYRKQKKYNEAIFALRRFLEIKHKRIKNHPNNHGEQEACAAAYFNIACYHALKAMEDQEQEKRLLNEAMDALRQVKEHDQEMAKTAIHDPDLRLLFEKNKDFVKELS